MYVRVIKPMMDYISSIIVYGESALIGKKKVITPEIKPSPANFYGEGSKANYQCFQTNIKNERSLLYSKAAEYGYIYIKKKQSVQKVGEL